MSSALSVRRMYSVARGSMRRRQARRARRCRSWNCRVGGLGDLADRFVQRQARMLLGRARVDLVVDVGDVARVGDVIGAVDVAQQPEQHVEHDHRPRVADVGVVVDGRPAHVHAHVAGIDGLERLLPARQRVVERECHNGPLKTLASPLAGVSLSRGGQRSGAAPAGG